eukprot:549051-Karenia_brevis.AAC.1
MGYPSGHPGRGLGFAFLNGVLAVVEPDMVIAGLDLGASHADDDRIKRFCQEHASLFCRARFTKECAAEAEAWPTFLEPARLPDVKARVLIDRSIDDRNQCKTMWKP